jgi:glycosyltransferase involved in cell wall biosynthesis
VRRDGVRKRRVLLLTPATKFGSWAWFDKIIRASADDVEWLVVSFGKPPNPPANVRFVSLPETDYARIGRLMSSRRLLALNLLYYLPLLPLAWVAGVRFRPDIVIGNGALPTAMLLPFKLLRCRVLLAFHGYVGHTGGRWHTLLRGILSRSDRAFVNSVGSVDDLARVMPAERIVLVRHWADARFFAVPLERPRGDRLRVLFVGRLDGEKFAQCLRVCQKLADEGRVELQAVGGGQLDPQRNGAGIVGLGYVDDLDQLAAIYAGADLVWAPADTTYLSLPGVEGLAAGCPVVVSDVPAVDVRAREGVRVPRDLVSPPIGNVVDGTNDDEALALLRRLADEGVTAATRALCREHADRFHSPRNLELVLQELRRGRG